jgi:hypothetical protein
MIEAIWSSNHTEGIAMRRHVIVEGMDGSGKDTLIGKMRQLLPHYQLHERASTSLGGPVDNLTKWTMTDVLSMDEQPSSIYNRHPLISEPIYADIRTPPGDQHEWLHARWAIEARTWAAARAILVICQPPFGVISDNLARDPAAHMAGVVPNAPKLYARYAAALWPGMVVRYDYTRDDVYELMSILVKSLEY